MLKNKKKKKKGFTLIELVIVLAVLAIIAIIAIPNFTKVRQDSMRKADERTGDVIKRAVLTKIADQKVIVGQGGGEIIVTPVATAGTAPTVAAGTGNITFSASSTNPAIDAGNVDLAKDLKEVRPPQEKGKNVFVVTISADESVTDVKTAAGPTASTPNP